MRTSFALALALGPLLAGIALAEGDGLPGNEASQKAYAEGWKAASAKDWKTAMEHLYKAVTLDPKNYLAHYDLGEVLEAQNEKAKATASFEKAVELCPEFAMARLKAGSLEMSARNVDKAIALLAPGAVEKKPFLVGERWPPAQVRAQTLFLLCRLHAAKKEFGIANAIAQSFPKDKAVDHDYDPHLKRLADATAGDLKPFLESTYGAQLAAIRKDVDAGKHKPALAAYERFEKLHPGNELKPVDAWSLYEGMAAAQVGLKDHAKAADALAKAAFSGRSIGHRPLEDVLFRLAASLAEQKKDEDALKRLEEVLWLEAVTRFDPASADRKPFAGRVESEDSFKNLKGVDAWKKLAARYKAE